MEQRPNYRFIIANISWNPSGWRSPYTNPRAGHKYVKNKAGHESLNFDFNKKGLDSKDNIYGYICLNSPPTKLVKKSVIFFYSKNYLTYENFIVGIYGNAEILKNIKETKWRGFDGNLLESNIVAEKRYSLLFPIPLDADKYKKGRNRLVPQANFTYIDEELAEEIITDEIKLLKSSNITQDEFIKIKDIYELITGKSFSQEHFDNDNLEQKELQTVIMRKIPQDQIKNRIIEELSSISPKTLEFVEVNQKVYKRDNKTIAQLKILRGFKCQICSYAIKIKDGSFYVEAAHIKPKSDKGPETPDNLLILCPNHHKEFDLGNKKIISHTKDRIKFELNGKLVEIDLSLK